jgi:hypothetical protein
MLKLVKYLAMGLILGLTTSAIANQNSRKSFFSTMDDVVVRDQYGHEVPFPKSALIPFPWEKIEGFWEANIDEMEGVFGFTVDKSDSRRALKVIYMNQTRTLVLAQGVGYLTVDQKVIHAFIKGPGFNYMLSVGAYSVNHAGIVRTEMVTSLTPMQKIVNTRPLSNFIIRKVN